MCICPKCPTYQKCKLTGGLFCAKGRAEEKATKEGCICAKCTVYSKYNLKGEYFCRKPEKMLWWILGLAVIIIIVAVIVWIMLSGGSPASHPIETPSEAPQ